MEDPGSSMLTLLLMIALLGLSALFSGSETAFFGLSPYRLRELTDGGHKKAQHVSALLRRPDKLLTTLLVGNTAVNIAFTTLMTVTVLALTMDVVSVELGNGLATIAATTLLLVFGEVTPKALAAHRAETFAFQVVGLIQWIGLLLKPITILVDFVSSIILRLTGVRVGGFKQTVVTEEIIKTAVTIGEETGTVEEDERNMIYNIFESTDIQVSNVMIPKDDMVCIDEEETLRSAAHLLADEGFSRLPVISSKSGSEFVVGVLYAKDLLSPLRNKKYDLPVAGVMRAPHFSRPKCRVSTLLTEMRQIGRHLSIVRDEDSKILGLITLEDLLEVIVGDIMDEHDYEDMLAVQGGQQ